MNHLRFFLLIFAVLVSQSFLYAQETSLRESPTLPEMYRDFVGRLEEKGWFGTVETASGEHVSLIDSQDLLDAVKSFTAEKCPPRVTSFTVIERNSLPVISYRIIENGSIEVRLRINEAERQLQSNLLRYIRMLAFLESYHEVEEVKQQVTNGVISKEVAVEQLDKHEYRVLQQVKEFANSHWVDFCESLNVVSRNYDGWCIEGDFLSDFESFRNSEYGIRLKNHTEKTVQEWVDRSQ